MATLSLFRNRKSITFEDLRGKRAKYYIRDSTPDQRDGFGPEIQRKNIIRFAESYGLILSDECYTEFISSFKRWDKRQQFHQFLDDAELDAFDVLLADHTSRFGRNQEECIHYKERMHQLGKVIVFVSQGIISGSDRDFLNERINETLDEQFSRNLSRYVSSGMSEKAGAGLANGLPPLGYKSLLEPNKPECKVPDSKTMPALMVLLKDYATGSFSFRDVADHLNSLGYKTRYGNLFTGHTVKDVLHNRFYEGKVVYHQGLSDEQIIDGCHEVSQEIRDLWLECQQVKKERMLGSRGQPRAPTRHFPFSKVLRCQRCNQPFYGEAARWSGKVSLRLSHERQNAGRYCDARPRSQTVETVSQQFQERVLSHLILPDNWKSTILTAMQKEDKRQDNSNETSRVQRALENLRKQHLWGDISDDDYRKERSALERQMKLISPPSQSHQLPNLERAAELLKNMPVLWSHSGVTDEQRESFLQEMFVRISIDGNQITSIEPKGAYAPLFATMTSANFGYCGAESTPSPPETELFYRVLYHRSSILFPLYVAIPTAEQ